MSPRKTAPIEFLAADVLGRIPRPYSEDVIEDVFLTIEADPSLHARYRALEGEFTKHVVNQMLGVYTKQLTEMETIREVDAHRSQLIKNYSKLQHRGS